MEDWQLLREYVEHASESAFAELMDRHLDMVYSTAFRWLGETDAAEDIAQAVFCLLAKKARNWRSGTLLVGWLYRTTYFLATRQRDKEYRRRRREQEAVYMSSIDTNSDSPVSWEQVAPLLDAAMHQLKEPDQQALLLRFFSKKPLHEVGKDLGISEDAARMRVNRSLEKLRVTFLKKGVACPILALGMLLTEKAVSAAPLSAVQSIRAGVLQTIKITTTPSFFATMLVLITKSRMRMAVAAVGSVLLLFSVALFLFNQFQGHPSEVGAPASPRTFKSSRTSAIQSRISQSNRNPFQTNRTRTSVELVQTGSTNLPPQQISVNIKFVEIKDDEMGALGPDLFLGNIPITSGNSAPQGPTPQPVMNAVAAPFTSQQIHQRGVFPSPTAGASFGEAGNMDHSQDAAIGVVPDNSRIVRRVSMPGGILTESQFNTVLKALEQRSGVDVISSPTVMSLSGQQAQVAVMNIKPILIPKDGLGVIELEDYSRPPESGTRNMKEAISGSNDSTSTNSPSSEPQLVMIPSGMMIGIIAEVLADGFTIKLTLQDTILDQIIYGNSDAQGEVMDRGQTGGQPASARASLRYSIRENIAKVTVRDGQTVVLNGLHSGRANQAANARPKKQLLIFATPRVVDPAGNRLYAGDDLPYDPNSVPLQEATETQR